MNTRRKLAAAALVALLGMGGYGVYATNLDVSDSSSAFAAGSVPQPSIKGFDATVVAGEPVFNASSKEFSFPNVRITPNGSETWAAVGGKKITVIGYDKRDNKEVTGTATAPTSGTATVTVPLPTNDPDEIVEWSVVIQ